MAVQELIPAFDYKQFGKDARALRKRSKEIQALAQKRDEIEVEYVGTTLALAEKYADLKDKLGARPSSTNGKGRADQAWCDWVRSDECPDKPDQVSRLLRIHDSFKDVAIPDGTGLSRRGGGRGLAHVNSRNVRN